MSRCLHAPLLSLGGLLLVLSGCEPPPGVMKFNNMMARANSKLSEKGKAFYNAISPLSKGQAVAPATARAAADDVASTLREVRGQFAFLLPPTGSRNGPLLLSRYRDFLETQQKIYDGTIAPAVQIIEDNARYPEPFNKWQAIQQLLAKAPLDEGPAMDNFRKVHTDYLKAHNLEAK